MNERANAPTGTLRATAGDVLLVGLVLALFAGMFDVSMSMLEKPAGLGRVGAIPPMLLATSALAFAIYVVAWFLVGRPIALGFRLDRGSTAIALAIFLGGAFTLILLGDLHVTGLSPPVLFRHGIVFLLSSTAAVGAYQALSRSTDPQRFGRTFGLALPVLFFQLLVWEWFELYRAEAASLSSAAASAVLGVVACSTVAVLLRTRRSRFAPRAIVIFAAFLVATLPFAHRYAAEPTFTDANQSASPRSPRHIVLITVDTLRAGSLSSYDPTGGPTTEIDRFAKDGVLFENAVSPAPWTLPSLASMLTGLSPSVHVVTEMTSRMSGNVTTLGEHLAESGYHTAAIVTNELLRPDANFSQGYRDYIYLNQPSFGGSVGARLLQATLPAAYPPTPWPSTTDTTHRAVRWLEHNRDADFFLWVHYFDPHAPYAPPREYLPASIRPGMPVEVDPIKEEVLLRVPPRAEQRWMRQLYDAEVRYVDDNIGRLLDALRELGIYDEALIMLTSDHGEEFWDHGGQGHGHSQYNELLLVPLIVKLPETSRTGRVSAMVSTASITPTVLDISGLSYDPAGMSSPSIAPLLTGDPENYHDVPIVSTAQMLFAPKEAVFFDDLKYIGSRHDENPSLFQLDRDPRELRSVAYAHPALIARAQRLLTQHLEASTELRARYQIAEEAARLDEDTLRRLRALGYVR